MARAFVASAPSPYTVSVGNSTSPPALRQRTALATASGVTVMTRVDGSAVTSYLISLRPSGALVIRPASSRSVAQPGRAPRSGRGGRRFKSCHSDHCLAQIAASLPRNPFGLTYLGLLGEQIGKWSLSPSCREMKAHADVEFPVQCR